MPSLKAAPKELRINRALRNRDSVLTSFISYKIRHSLTCSFMQGHEKDSRDGENYVMNNLPLVSTSSSPLVISDLDFDLA
jgi:hypothetical protein